MEPRVRRAFLDGLESLRNRLDAADLARLIEQGQTDEILRLLRVEVTDEAFRPLEAAIQNAVAQGGQTLGQIAGTVLGPIGEVQFVFGEANPRLAQVASTLTSARIREVGNDVRAVVREVITEETVAGRNPRDTARRIRESIGLTARQERAVSNYRRMLEQGDREALQRELRDRRFDPSVERATRAEDRQPLSQAQIDRMVGRYREKYIRYRSQVIGRTEAIRAIQAAHHELLNDMVREGRLQERQIRRFWHYTRDDRTRAEHRLIPAMNPNGVGLNEPFETPLGPLMYPGDPNGLAENVIQCRCAAFPSIVSLERLELEEAAGA
jgi:hypothetical protein